MERKYFSDTTISLTSEFCFYTGVNLFRMAEFSNASALLYILKVTVLILRVLTVQAVPRIFKNSG